MHNSQKQRKSLEEIRGTTPLEGIYSGKKQIQLPTPLLQAAITKQKNTGLQEQCQGAFPPGQ